MPNIKQNSFCPIPLWYGHCSPGIKNGAARRSSLNELLFAFMHRQSLSFSFTSSFRKSFPLNFSPSGDFSSILCLYSGLVTNVSGFFYPEVNTTKFSGQKSVSLMFSTELCRLRVEGEDDIALVYSSTDFPVLLHCLLLNILQTSAHCLTTIGRCWNS